MPDPDSRALVDWARRNFSPHRHPAQARGIGGGWRHLAPSRTYRRNALAAHGYQRATTDIDLMVAATAEAGSRIKVALMVLPDQAAKDPEPAWFTEGENIRVGDAIIVDIMLNANGQTYDMLKQYAQIVDVEGVRIRTVDLEGLLLTKRTTREKDRMDCIVIERALVAFQWRSQADK